MMKRIVFLVITFFIFSNSALALTLGQLKQNLDPDKNTRVYVKDYWKKVSGKKVVWKGRVHDVSGGVRNRYKIFIKAGNTLLDYNVVLAIKQQGSVATLKKGQAITFTGHLHDYSWRSRHHLKKYLEKEKWIKEIVIVLDNAKVNGL